MSKIRRFLKPHWEDVKGNAKWDFIKWGCVMMAASIGALVKYLLNSRIGSAILVGLTVGFFLFIVITLMQRLAKTRKTKPVAQSSLSIYAGPMIPRNDMNVRCPIIIHNTSHSKTVENIVVKIISIKPMPRWMEHFVETDFADLPQHLLNPGQRTEVDINEAVPNFSRKTMGQWFVDVMKSSELEAKTVTYFVDIQASAKDQTPVCVRFELCCSGKTGAFTFSKEGDLIDECRTNSSPKESTNTPLTVELEKGKFQAPIGMRDGAHLKVHNNSKTHAAENVKVLLLGIDPLPNHSHLLSLDKTKPLPDRFPVDLKTESSDGGVINPDSDSWYELFQQVRHGSAPSMHFIAKDREYGLYSTMHTEHLITIEVSAKNFSAIRMRYRITFIERIQGMPLEFTIERI